LLRVACSNSIGRSEYSGMISFLTPACAPGKCPPPVLVVPPHQSSSTKSRLGGSGGGIQLKWNQPEFDGGAAIVNYELAVRLKADNESEDLVVYRGGDMVHTLTSLAPDRNYACRVRALNKVGPGEWSDPVEFVSGPGVPDAPQPPLVSAKSHASIVVSWLEPASNGLPITEYRLEWALKQQESAVVAETYTTIYTGPNLRYELKPTTSQVQPAIPCAGV
jgi:predicted phage tail protein